MGLFSGNTGCPGIFAIFAVETARAAAASRYRLDLFAEKADPFAQQTEGGTKPRPRTRNLSATW
jgi:hypothetical protein